MDDIEGAPTTEGSLLQTVFAAGLDKDCPLVEDGRTMKSKSDAAKQRGGIAGVELMERGYRGEPTRRGTRWPLIYDSILGAERFECDRVGFESSIDSTQSTEI